MNNPKKPKVPKCKNMMYEQQLAHLPFSSIEDLTEHIQQNLQPKRFAAIVHDKDIDDKGSPVAEHIHCMLSFENARSINNIANLLNDKPQYIEAWNDKAANGFAYLVHATKNAQTKYQYEPSDVIANFDYPAYLANLSDKVNRAKKISGNNRIEDVLDLLGDREIDRQQAIEMLTGSQYASAKRRIDDVYALLLQKKAEEWRKEMAAQEKHIKVLWLFGKSGAGKTVLAKTLAQARDEPFYISGSSKDPFQSYQGQHTIILDELRPDTIPYHDLLRILDPYGLSDSLVFAPSRYNDKALAADMIIVTTPYNPYNFYTESVERRNIDSFEQLLRRITMINYLTDSNIYLMEYNAVENDFKPVDGQVKPNPYSSASRPQKSTTESAELFDEITSRIPDTGMTAAPEDGYDRNLNYDGIPFQQADDIDREIDESNDDNES